MERAYTHIKISLEKWTGNCQPETQIIAEPGDLIYQDPGTRKWETADAYLSGDVREKLAIAERASPHTV